MRLPWWALVVAFVAGWLASWWTNRPDEDWRVWQRRVEAFQRDTARVNAQTRAFEVQRDAAVREARQLRVEKDSVIRIANELRGARLVQRRRADSLMQVMLAAATPEARYAACRDVLVAREDELTTCERETAQLRDAIALADSAATRDSTALAIERVSHDSTKAQRDRATRLLGEAPKPAGCPLPFCLAIDAHYEPWDQALFVGVSMPLGKLFRVGPLRRIK